MNTCGRVPVGRQGQRDAQCRNEVVASRLLCYPRGARHFEVSERHVPESSFAKRSRTGCARWATGYTQINQQLGAGCAELSATAAPLLDRDDQQTEFTNMAGLMAEPELFITVDTSIAHVPGAIGCEKCALLSYGADLRWLAERADRHCSNVAFRDAEGKARRRDVLDSAIFASKRRSTTATSAATTPSSASTMWS